MEEQFNDIFRELLLMTGYSPFQFNDGGRADAGFKGFTNDCVARAIAIASGESYLNVYNAINSLANNERMRKGQKNQSSARNGVYKDTTHEAMKLFGFEWHPTMTIGSGCTTHLRADELPSGNIIVKVSRHVAAVIDGVIHDTFDPSRNGKRCVYGYWSKEDR